MTSKLSDFSSFSILAAIDAIPKSPPVRKRACNQTCEPWNPWQEGRRYIAIPYLGLGIVPFRRLAETFDDINDPINGLLKDRQDVVPICKE